MKYEEYDFPHHADNVSCDEFEMLISRACDGECTPEQLEALKEHLGECDDCRNLMKEYRELSDRMITRAAMQSCPPPPVVSREEHTPGFFANRDLLFRLGGIAACIAFFFVGHFFGVRNANEKFSNYLSPMVVATPTMWAANRPVSPYVSSNLESEQPFTDSIEKYRSAIADELRRGEIDWMKVRDLVEAMGELRTDLELLTIHMAFLDIRTGSSPYEVADHWERLGGNLNRIVYKP